jgi:hypothetical protein
MNDFSLRQLIQGHFIFTETKDPIWIKVEACDDVPAKHFSRYHKMPYLHRINICYARIIDSLLVDYFNCSFYFQRTGNREPGFYKCNNHVW